MFGVLQEGTNSFAPVTRTKVQVNYFLRHHVEQFHDGHAQHTELQKKIGKSKDASLAQPNGFGPTLLHMSLG